MGDFVSPPKIWLTILIDMYRNKAFCEEDSVKILPFITSHLLPGLTTGTHSSSGAATKLSLDSIKAALCDLTVNLQSVDAERTGSGNLWRTFVYRHCEIATLKDLDSHFITLVNPDAPPSLFSAFMDRVRLSYEQLRFENQMRVWHDFARHRSRLIEEYMDIFTGDVLSSYRLKVALSRKAEGDATLEQSLYRLVAQQHENRNAVAAGDQDLEAILQFQIEQMQRYGARVDLEIENKLNHFLRLSESSSAHYYSFLSSWHAGDYYSALDNLHRYYDYTMPEHDRSQYPYACLNMAVLQADFGSFEEALPAINEAISAAREAKDYNCLAFCLIWLYHFNLHHSTESTRKLTTNMLGSDDAGLAYLRQQAKEHKLHNLESSILLSQTNAITSKGTSPLQAFQRLHESSSLILQYDLSNMAGRPMFLKSSLFGDLGLLDISRPYTDLGLGWYRQSLSLIDRVQAMCQKALTHTLAGQREEAHKLIRLAEEEASANLKQSQLVSQYKGINDLKNAINQNNHRAAKLLVRALKGAPSPDPTLEWTVALLEIDHHIRLHDFTQALSLTSKYLEALKESPVDFSAPVSLRLRLLNAKSRIFIRAGRPQKALTLTVRAATAARKARLFTLLWESIALLMHVLNSVKCQDLAIELGDLFVEQAHESGDEALLAEMQDAMHTSCLLKVAEAEDDEARARYVQLVEQWTRGAIASYDALGDELASRLLLAKDAELSRQLGLSSQNQGEAQQTQVATETDEDWDFSKLEGLAIEI